MRAHSPTLLETRDDVANEAALEAVGLDSNESVIIFWRHPLAMRLCQQGVLNIRLLGRSHGEGTTRFLENLGPV